MSSNIDLKALWNNGAKSEVPDASEILKKGSQMQRKARMRMTLCNLLLVINAIFIVWVWIECQPKMITTKLGMVLILGAIGFFVIRSMGYVGMLYQDHLDSSTSDYLQHMLKVKQEQEALFSTKMNIYFGLLGTGMFLYLIEYASRGSLTFQILAYGITFGWMAFVWFYIRPKRIRVQRARLNVIIDKLEEVNGQLREE